MKKFRFILVCTLAASFVAVPVQAKKRRSIKKVDPISVEQMEAARIAASDKNVWQNDTMRPGDIAEQEEREGSRQGRPALYF